MLRRLVRQSGTVRPSWCVKLSTKMLRRLVRQSGGVRVRWIPSRLAVVMSRAGEGAGSLEEALYQDGPAGGTW